MKKLLAGMLGCLMCFNASAKEINTNDLNLNEEQIQKIKELKENLKAEIQPVWEEIESNREKITEIEKHYFEQFWNLLTDEQREKFAQANQ